MSLHDIRIFFLLNLWNSDFFLNERTGFFLGLEGTYPPFHSFHFSRGLTYLLGLEEAFRLCYFSFNEFLMGRNICWGSVRMWEILVNGQGWISYVSYVSYYCGYAQCARIRFWAFLTLFHLFTRLVLLLRSRLV